MRGLSFVFCCVTLAFARTALADAASDQAAQQLFDAGRQLSDAGKYTEACPKFEQSEALSHGTGTLLNLADCYDKLGRTASAWKTFLRAADSARAAGNADREKLALVRVSVLESRLMRIHFVVRDSKPESLHLYLDGQELSRELWSQSLAFDPGSYTVRAERDSKVWSQAVTLNVAGATSDVVIPDLDGPTSSPPAVAASTQPPAAPLAPTPPAGAPPAATVPPAAASAAPPGAAAAGGDQSASSRQWAYITGGVGLAGFAVSGVFALLAKSKYSDSLDHCRTKDLCTTQGLTLRDQARSNGDIATVGFVVGVGGALVSTILFLSDSPSSPHARIHAAPRLARGQAGLDLGYAF